MGDVHKTRKQRPGYNTYKTVMALRMASAEGGTTPAEVGGVAGCSKTAALHTLKHLVLAGECILDVENGHYYSDVYRDIPDGNYSRITAESEQQDINPPDTYKDAVISVILATQAGMISQYPVAIFREQGLFVSRVIAKTFQEIIEGLNEIT